ncbi:hypothetical protein EPO15_15565 [bacterium]|nr:MAG: hypothetical protein EPO15_15565 [bacterium]
MLRKIALLSGSLALAAALTSAARAEDEAPAAEAPAAEAPAAAPETPAAEPAPEPAPAPAPEKPKPLPAAPSKMLPAPNAGPATTPAAAPAPKPKPLPAPAPAAKAEPAAACLLNGPAADTVGCVKAYKTLADGYLEAYKAVDRWLAGISSEMKGAADRIADLEAKVAESEGAVTKLKLDRSKDAKLRLKDLDVANKKLWAELEAARKDEETRCKAFAREAAQKVKDINVDITARLTAAGKAVQ